MYPALNGDCFLVRSDTVNVLFDGGYARTFEEHLLHDLEELAAEGQALDLLIATHIDQDHILGLIAFLEANGSTIPRKIVEVCDVWFNSLRCLAGHIETPLPAHAKQLVAALARQGFKKTTSTSATAAKKISAKQGSTLGTLIRRNGYRWNGADGNSCIQQNHSPVSLTSSASLNILGPSKKRLDGLRQFWITALMKRGYKGPFGSNDDLDEAFEITCNRAPSIASPIAAKISGNPNRTLSEVYAPDKSVTNGSSIATLLTADGARVLFLADAWAEDTVEALEKLRADGESMHFDAIKVAHHGSVQNTSPQLLSMIDAPHYFISSNGSIHEHPDVEVLRAIVDRPASFSRTLHFNYDSPASIALKSHVSAAAASFIVVENSDSWVDIRTTK